MSPQFVDYNADKRMDIVTATFDGSPHVSLGSAKGFLEPERILDSKGRRVLLTQFWNYESKKWDNMQGEGYPKGHCTSAVAFDWDNDGDLDLLLGSYGDGNLFRQMNEGKPGQPSFTGVSIPVTADDAPFAIAGGVTTPRLVDWDGDGLTDLLVGGFGDSYQNGPGGGVALYRNKGKLGAPQFAAPLMLIAKSPKGADQPTRPDSGLYADAVDYDGDGDLDLVVGGYSHWSPEPRELTAQEKARIKELEALTEKTQKTMMELSDKAFASIDKGSAEEREAALTKLRESSDYIALSKKHSSARRELKELRPGPKRESFVWLYRRTGVSVF